MCSETGTWPYFGAFTDKIPLAPGATITFSAYIKTVDATVTVGIERQSDYASFDSEIVPAGTLVVVYNWDNAWGYNPIPQSYLAK